LFVGFSGTISCSKKAPEPDPKPEPKPDPEPEPEKSLNYIYNSESVEEINLYKNDVLKTKLSAEYQEKNFQNRPKYFRPQTMKFEKDSLFINKLGDFKEAYKFKWEKNQLFIYNDITNSWKHFADKDDKNQISINIVHYKSQINSQNSNAVRVGQLYNPASISEILSEKSRAEMETLWLKLKTIYVPEK